MGNNRTRNGNEWDVAIESGDGIDTNFGYNHSRLVGFGLVKGMSGKDNGVNELGGETDLLHNDPLLCIKISFAANLDKK